MSRFQNPLGQSHNHFHLEVPQNNIAEYEEKPQWGSPSCSYQTIPPSNQQALGEDSLGMGDWQLPPAQMPYEAINGSVPIIITPADPLITDSEDIEMDYTATPDEYYNRSATPVESNIPECSLRDGIRGLNRQRSASTSGGLAPPPRQYHTQMSITAPSSPCTAFFPSFEPGPDEDNVDVKTMTEAINKIKSLEKQLADLKALRIARAETQPRSRVRRFCELEGSSSNEVCLPRGKRQRFNEEQRRATALTRQIRSCVRCRRLKARCEINPKDPLGPCLVCRQVDPRYLHIRCIRTRITEVIIFRTNTSDNDTWTRRDEVYIPTDIHRQPTHLKKIQLAHHNKGFALEATVTSFTPIEYGETCYQWIKDGRPGMIELPHYALHDVKELKLALCQYIDKHVQVYLVSHLGEAIISPWKPFGFALRRARYGNSVLLCKALRLWMASRLIEDPWRICSKDALGMQVHDFDETPFNGRIPVTPIMDTQLDQVVIKEILQPLRAEVLKIIQRKLEHQHKEEWFEIFLALFILLNSVELAVNHDHEFATFFGHSTPGRGNRFEDYTLIENFFHSAQAMIAHFRDHIHFAPFWGTMVSANDMQNLGLDEDEREWIYALRMELARPETLIHIQRLKTEHKYETVLFWCHQLFVQDWDSSPIQIKEMPPPSQTSASNVDLAFLTQIPVS